VPHTTDVDLTAKVRNDLVRVLGRSNFDHLLILASDFDTLEFVFLHKDKDVLRDQLLEPLFKKLGFKPTVNRPSKTDQTKPDYLLKEESAGTPAWRRT
jgi:hypothetical protein